MATASPGARVDPAVNLKPNPDTERGLCPIVTPEVDRELPHHHIGPEVTPQAGAEAGRAEAAATAAAAPTAATTATGRPAGADPGAVRMTPTAGPGRTLTTATTAGVGAGAGARGATVTTEAEVTTGGPGVVDLMALTVKVTEVTLITGAPVKAADIAENDLF